MQVDVRRRGVSYGNRKLEFLSLAEKTANRIRAVAEQIPAVELPSYVRSPYGFVTAVTMEYKQLDRLILFFHKTALFYEKDTAQGRCHSVS